MKMVSFVVLNWNGERIIFKCLNSILIALKNYEGKGEVIVVDNGSSDGSVSLIEKEFSEAKLIKLEKNIGFSEGNNIGVKESQGDIVILVNNDVYVHPDFLKHIVFHFNEPQVFSIGPKVYGLDGKTLMIGRSSAYFHYGLIKAKFSKDIYSSPVPCLFASGGSGAFDRKKYLELGGLLDLLYCEDLELGYRAWKWRGWRTIYEPRSWVYHDLGTSFTQVFTRKELKIIRERNRFLFQWYGISDPIMVFKHFFYLPFLLIYSLLKGKWNYPMGLIQAIRAWRTFKRQADKKINKNEKKLKDKEILMITREALKGR